MHDRTTQTGERPGLPAERKHIASAPGWRGMRIAGTALFAAALPVAFAEPGAAAAPRTFALAALPLPLPTTLTTTLQTLPAIADADRSADVAPAEPAAPGASGASAASGALGDASLDTLRGGTETPWSDMRLGGTVGGNTAVNVATGANTITDGAFSNASGLPMVIQNSGANVLIQNATIVNVQIR